MSLALKLLRSLFDNGDEYEPDTDVVRYLLDKLDAEGEETYITGEELIQIIADAYTAEDGLKYQPEEEPETIKYSFTLVPGGVPTVSGGQDDYWDGTSISVPAGLAPVTITRNVTDVFDQLGHDSHTAW